MTILILDHPGSPLPPYARWLADCGEDLVLFTGRAPSEIAGTEHDGYAEVRCFPDYTTSADVERGALELAGRAAVSSIVAVAYQDMIRSAALRDHLRLPGQRRDDALVCADLMMMRERLSEEAVSAIPAGPVRRAVDLYWYANRWGYPIRVRQRRVPRWPVTHIASDETELAALIPGLFKAGFDAAPSLMLEPHVPGTRVRAVVTGSAQAPRVSLTEHAEPLLELLTRAMLALPWAVDASRVISAVRGQAGDWLIDSISADVGDEETCRQVVRSQAGVLREGMAALR